MTSTPSNTTTNIIPLGPGCNRHKVRWLLPDQADAAQKAWDSAIRRANADFARLQNRRCSKRSTQSWGINCNRSYVAIDQPGDASAMREIMYRLISRLGRISIIPRNDYYSSETAHYKNARMRAILQHVHRHVPGSTIRPADHPRPQIIAVEGALAVGKTTTLECLSHEGFVVLYEGVDDGGWSVRLPCSTPSGHRAERTVHLLSEVATSFSLRASDQLQLLITILTEFNFEVARSLSDTRFVIIERSCIGHQAFIRSGLENHTLSSGAARLLQRAIIAAPYFPDRVVHLTAAPDVSMRRMRQRGRSAEKNLEPLYNQHIANYTADAVQQYSDHGGHVLHLDTTARCPGEVADLIALWINEGHCTGDSTRRPVLTSNPPVSGHRPDRHVPHRPQQPWPLQFLFTMALDFHVGSRSTSTPATNQLM